MGACLHVNSRALLDHAAFADSTAFGPSDGTQILRACLTRGVNCTDDAGHQVLEGFSRMMPGARRLRVLFNNAGFPALEDFARTMPDFRRLRADGCFERGDA